MGASRPAPALSGGTKSYIIGCMVAHSILGQVTFATCAAVLVAALSGLAPAQANGLRLGHCLIADAGPSNDSAQPAAPCLVGPPPEVTPADPTGTASPPFTLRIPGDLHGDSAESFSAFEYMAARLNDLSREERQAWVSDASGDDLRRWRSAAVAWIARLEDGDPRALYETTLRLRDDQRFVPTGGAILGLFLRAGERGVPEGYFDAGQLFLSVSLTQFQKSIGFQYLVEAGRAGYGPAQAEIGIRFAGGRGVRQSDFAAYTWLLIARDSGQSVGNLIREVESRLSPEARQDAVGASADPNTAPAK